MDKVILTRSGYEKLVEELNFLKTKKRREVADQLEHARALGDLRENSEYETAKEAKHQLEILRHVGLLLRRTFVAAHCHHHE